MVVGMAESDILAAARAGNLSRIQHALALPGASINARDGLGFTGLLLAATQGRADILTQFVDKGANVNHQNDENATALMLAAEHGHRAAAELLLDAGAERDLQNEEGNTALMLAVENAHEDLVKLLLERGARLDLVNIQGETARTLAGSSPIADRLKTSVYRRMFHATRNRSTDGSTDAFLGAGGYGAVRRVLHEGTPYALKRMRLSKQSLPSNGLSPLKAASFEREVRGLERVAPSPYVLQMKNHATNGMNGYILTELLTPGTTLRTAIDTHILTDENVKAVVEQLLRGLTSIHDLGVLHLDIKPDNLWVYPDHRIKYLDFGLACRNPCINHLDNIAGTLRYVKFWDLVEGVEQDTVVQDKRSDFYALSKTLEDITKAPLSDDTTRWIHAIAARLLTLRDGDQAVDALVHSAGGRTTVSSRLRHNATRKRRGRRQTGAAKTRSARRNR